MAVASITGGSAYIRTITGSNYTVGRDDDLILADATTGAVNITLPSAASEPGNEHKVKRIDGVLANAVTVIGTIDGVANKTLVTQNVAYTFKSDGANWQII